MASRQRSYWPAVFLSLASLALGLAMSGCAGSSPPAVPTAITLSSVRWATDAPWHKPGQDAIGAVSLDIVGAAIDSVVYSTTTEYEAAVTAILSTT